MSCFEKITIYKKNFSTSSNDWQIALAGLFREVKQGYEINNLQIYKLKLKNLYLDRVRNSRVKLPRTTAKKLSIFIIGDATLSSLELNLIRAIDKVNNSSFIVFEI